MEEKRYNYLAELLLQAEGLKNGFITIEDGSGFINVRVNRTEEFSRWKADVRIFLEVFTSESSKRIISIIDKMKGWHDERDFQEIVALLYGIKKQNDFQKRCIDSYDEQDKLKGGNVVRKLQVFISSTYRDLLEEREAAVSAILNARHIPAGMELFKSGKGQMETIKKWIDDSDVYMLILGGRYGTIDSETGKSYTHLEYEYAKHKKIPIFSVVINEKELEKRVKETGAEILEIENNAKYKEFREVVLSDICGFFDDVKDIKYEISSNLKNIEQTTRGGWIKWRENSDKITELQNENKILKEEKKKLKDKISALEIENLDKNKIDEYDAIIIPKTYNNQSIARFNTENNLIFTTIAKYMYSQNESCIFLHKAKFNENEINFIFKYKRSMDICEVLSKVKDAIEVIDKEYNLS